MCTCMVNLNIIGTDLTGSHSSWNATIGGNYKAVTFKLDTGAEVTAITEPAFFQLRDILSQAPTETLHGPDQQPLKILGQVTLTLTSKGQVCTHNDIKGASLHTQCLHGQRSGAESIRHNSYIEELNLELLAKVAELSQARACNCIQHCWPWTSWVSLSPVYELLYTWIHRSI